MDAMRASRPPALRHLRAFCVAARHRSFKVAAGELFLTPSAVSHQMKELEDNLGVRLFERKTRSLDLTQAGHTLLDDVAPLLKAIDQSVSQVAQKSRRRRLRVCVPPFFASELFVPRLASFCSTQPNIDIQVDTHEPRPSEHTSANDVSILLLETPPAGLQTERLFALRLVAVCARQDARKVLQTGRNVFREMALIVHRARPLAWNSWAEEAGLEAPEPKNVIELDTMFAVVRAAERGLGVALVPAALCDAWFMSGALVRVSPRELATSDAYFLVNRPSDTHKPEVLALTRWARSEFRAYGER